MVNFMLVANMKQMPNYVELNRVLNKSSLKLHPSEVHGLICGILCSNKANKNWEELIIGEEKEPAKTYELLQNLYNISAKQLDEFLFEFQLLLPEDSQHLNQRAEALSLWCQGFLTGLQSGKKNLKRSSDINEAINDVTEIAKMNYEDVVENEEDEAAYIELVEYVRMAIILIYQDRQELEGHKVSSSSDNIL